MIADTLDGVLPGLLSAPVDLPDFDTSKVIQVELRAPVALPENATQLHADGGTLTGSVHYVLGGSDAQILLLCREDAERAVWASIDLTGPEVRISDCRLVHAQLMADISFDGVDVAWSQTNPDLPGWLSDVAATLLCSVALGAAGEGSAELRGGAMSDVSKVETLRDGAVLVFTINGPSSGNAIGPDVYVAVTDAVLDGGNDPDVRAIVLTGAGAFLSSDGNINACIHSATGPLSAAISNTDLLHAMIRAIVGCPTPVIAAVEGAAAGAGAALAISSDLIVAAEEAGETEGPAAFLENAKPTFPNSKGTP